MDDNCFSFMTRSKCLSGTKVEIRDSRISRRPYGGPARRVSGGPARHHCGGLIRPLCDGPGPI